MLYDFHERAASSLAEGHSSGTTMLDLFGLVFFFFFYSNPEIPVLKPTGVKGHAGPGLIISP